MPLSEPEQAEVTSHLAFLRRFKAALRLSLNAAEDLMVNGARAPDDRGVVKHLLAKVDRGVIERALSREQLDRMGPQRAAFLAGVVRLNPDASVLLSYLETVAAIADRREAAAAFELTVDRIDFERMAPKELGRLLEVFSRAFAGPDLVQAALGLLASPSFARALERAEGQLPEGAEALFGPLGQAYKVVMRGQPIPEADRPRAQVASGLEQWLGVPDPVLRSYSLGMRVRLAELVLAGIEGVTPKRVPRGLLDSIPHGDPLYARLGLAWSERLLRDREDDTARSVLRQLAEAHPQLAEAERRATALGWPKIDRVVVDPRPEAKVTPRLTRGFWLDGVIFGLVRTAPPESAGRLVAEARLQAELFLPGVAPALAHGLGADGRAYLFLVPGGRPLGAQALALPEALSLAFDGVRLFKALSLAGVSLPDAGLERFFVRGKPATLTLVDLDGAMAIDPSRAAATHAIQALELVRRLLSSAPQTPNAPPRSDLPPRLADRLRGRPPLPILARALAEALARG